MRAKALPNLKETVMNYRRLQGGMFCLFACVAHTCWAHTLLAASPTIGNLSVRGLQSGATTTLTITGTNLLPEPRILLGAPIARQEVKPGAKPNQVQIDVTLDAQVTPGIYQFWLATAAGVSAPTAVGIDHLPEIPFASEIATLPVAMTGAVQGNAVLRANFTGHAKQRMVIEVEGRRLGSNLNPVLRLLDSRNVQLAWAQTAGTIFGDARIVAELPDDGRYTVELNDALYRGAAPGFFRLKIGELQFADMVFPLAVQRGHKGQLEFISSSLPVGAKVEADLTSATNDVPAPWPTESVAGSQYFSGARPRIVASEIPEVLEVASESMQQVTAPAAINGRLAIPGEEDRYKLIVTPGSKLRFEVLAQRAGSPVDGVLFIRNAAGAQLATSDDRPGTTDPGLDFNVPANVKELVVAVKDLNARGGPDFIYRIAISPIGGADYSLSVLNDRIELPASGNSVIRVRADRAGFQGPIQISIPHLPPGIQVQGDSIPAGATDALVGLHVDQTAPIQAKISIQGSAQQDKVSLRRPVLLVETPTSKYAPWLREELALAVTTPSPLNIAWQADSADMKLPLGTKLAANFKITRDANAKGAVRLSLLTSQIMPVKQTQDAKTKQAKTEDDIDRALRFETAPTIAADKDETATQIVVPGDLPQVPYDLAVQAELLGPDGKTVLATAVTSVRRLNTALPFAIELVGETKVDAKAGTGDTGKLTGKLKRLGSFNLPVTVTLTGLPAELPPPRVEVAADKSDFELPVSFPYNAAKGSLKNVKVVASSQPDPKAPRVYSNEVPVTVQVVEGGPPPALLSVFEDDSAFASYLTEGNGQALIETKDRYTGTAALRITAQQKLRAKLPGLVGIKIKEKPGEGEYRYLRFAWKKTDGNNILLQLNANDGSLKPLAAGETRPAFAYEAGDGANFVRAPAIRLGNTLPKEWTVVTRDLFADFGECTLQGLSFSVAKAAGAESGLFDHIYLAKSEEDFKGCPVPTPTAKPLAVLKE
jgi:hypothetical protein